MLNGSVRELVLGHLVAQLLEHQTPEFGSGYDLMVVRLSPVLGSVLGMEPT